MFVKARNGSIQCPEVQVDQPLQLGGREEGHAGPGDLEAAGRTLPAGQGPGHLCPSQL